MGLMISELLSGTPALAGGAAGSARPNETVPSGEGGTDEFASRLAAMLQQLRRNSSQGDDGGQRQEVAADATPGTPILATTSTPPSTPTSTVDGTVVLTGVATPTVAPSKVIAAKPMLGALILGPTLNVIKPVEQLPDTQSLMAFARSQGLDDRAIQWLLAPDAAASTATVEAVPVALPAEADATDLQALATQVMDMLRQWLAQNDPARPTPDLADLPSADTLFTLDKPTVVGAAESVDPTGGVQAWIAASPLAINLTLAQANPAAGTPTPTGVALATAPAATDGLTASIAGPTVPPGSPSGDAITDDPLMASVRAALDAATRIAAPTGEAQTTPATTSAVVASPQPQIQSQPQIQPLAEARQEVRQAITALIAALSKPPEDALTAIPVASASSRAATPAATDPQVLGHQAMVFVRAATRLQKAEAQPAPDTSALTKARPAPPVRTVEVDLTDAWIGDDDFTVGNDKLLAQRQAAVRDALASPLSTARALANRPFAQDVPVPPMTSAPAGSAAPADVAHTVNAVLGADRSSHVQPPVPHTVEDLSRQRTPTQSVNASAPGGDTGGYKPQDPHRGQVLAERMGEAVAQRLLQAVDRGEWSVKLALKPANLGHVEVQMRMHAGGLEAQFQASQSLTRDLLSDGLQRLRETLTQMGMDVAQLNVGGGRSQQRGGDSTPRQAATAKAAGVGTTEETDAKNQPIPIRPRSASGWDMLV